MANQRVDRRQILQGVGALGAMGALDALQSQTPARADDEHEEHAQPHRRLMLRGEVELVHMGERRFFGTYGLLVDVIEQWRLDGSDDTV